MTIARLNYLRNMLTKYSNAYYRTCATGALMSSRMTGWLDEYNEACYCRVWFMYCADSGLAPSHDAYDLFA